MKSALILIGAIMALASASHAATLNLVCDSATTHLAGTLEVDAAGKATGTLATTVTTATDTETSNTAFAGSLKVYPAGTFCGTSDVTIMMIGGHTAAGTQVAVKSVRGVDCQPNYKNGDVIYVSKSASDATCTLTK